MFGKTMMTGMILHVWCFRELAREFSIRLLCKMNIAVIC